MTDWKTKAAAAKAAAGLNAPAVMRPAKPGAVYTVLDKAVAFPKERLPSAGPRQTHGSRFAIVVQANVLCMSTDPVTVLIIPCSASCTAVGAADFAVPDDEPAFTKTGIVAYTSLVQPILKSELQAHVGDLRDDTLLNLQARMLTNMGIVGQSTAAVAAAQPSSPAAATTPVASTPMPAPVVLSPVPASVVADEE